MPLNVLLVEDDEYVRDLITDIVEPRGYRVVALGDGEAAWAACQREHFPLMLVDWGLPGIDGLELCRRVRSLPDGDRIVVLVITARDEPRALGEVLAAGASDYLSKPFDVSLLETRLTIAERQVAVLAERHHAEAALRETNEKLRTLIGAAPVAIIGFDPDCVVQSWNPAAERIFGWTASEMIGRRPAAICGVLDTVSSAIFRRAAPQAVVDVELAQVRRDGTPIVISLSASPVYDPRGRLAGVMAVALDVTERRHAAAERLRLTTILDATPDFVAMADATGRLTYLNQAGRRLVGVDEERPVGEIWVGEFHTAWSRRLLLDEALPAAMRDGVWTGETAFVHRDGRELPMLQQVLAHRAPNGDVEFLSTVARDISPQKEAERQIKALAETEKFRALGQMASGVAHDLNQYLGAVAGHGDLALRYLERPVVDVNAVRDSLEIVIRGAMDGAETVKRLLAFSRPRQDGDPIQVDLGELLRDVAKLTAPIWRDAAQAQSRPISLHVESSGDTSIEGWPASLKEAFTNLVFNAVDAMPHGGTIRLRALRQGQQVVAEVTDSGVGMTPEVQANLFVPFFSTKGERGSGLGMAIVYSLVERHQGQITVDSAPGRGSVFRLGFPAAHEAAARDTAPAPATRVRPLHILAVDDEPVLANMVASMLQIDGHTVDVATSGESAVDALARERFDLVLSDVGMGAGMNGWELATYIGAHHSDVHVVLVTGWGAQIEPDEMRERGIDAVIAKPYRIADLRRVVGDIAAAANRRSA